MRLEIKRDAMRIIPDDDRTDERDIAYIEKTMGLEKNGDTAICRRVNVVNSNRIAYLEITKGDCRPQLP